MNQSIQFPDQQQWHQAKGMVVFPALNGGQLIQCHVSLNFLTQHGELADSSSASVLALFEQLRFDLEELAEEKIANEDFDTNGDINLT
ncbi:MULTISPECIES: DUF1488 domain-containing protein [unclassified Motilimonas]|uniref:DUF1488 domain-containing protein n=1 Tax=unclassified Motilimonas TaxID=2643697 RepID=UPI001E52FA90|nr:MULTISPECIES: DUF1488 domain-containing protein [unclassified Motilimonas]MCE0556565.1 DUF1488 domain-containing protein [Motilimonas sp. E26]MDO6524868.1 DUF1488 domain-containing protein [Motilimonas sp. 1_MG-2023]